MYRLGLGLRLGNNSHTWACYYMTPYMRKLSRIIGINSSGIDACKETMYNMLTLELVPTLLSVCAIVWSGVYPVAPTVALVVSLPRPSPSYCVDG